MPPEAAAVALPVVAQVTGAVTFAITVGGGDRTIATVSVAVQPVESVTTTMFGPTVRLVAVTVVSVPFHTYT